MSHPADSWRVNGDSMQRGDGGPTGRYLLVFADNAHPDERAMTSVLQAVPGVSSVASASDFADGALDVEQANSADAHLFPTLGIAVVSAAAGPGPLAAAERDDRIVAIEPEQRLFALSAPSTEFLEGFCAAANGLYDRFAGGAAGNGSAGMRGSGITFGAAPRFVDTPSFTWGLQATGVSTSRATGQGVRLALLDTGYDAGHPDFTGRSIVSNSFVPGETAQDGFGHGTHVMGTSSGPARPPGGGQRYGCAPADSIYVGKVLSDGGSGTDSQILAGIEWAITNQCQVISMSLGADVPSSTAAYDAVGRRALAAGCLIVAAAGNSARRAQGSPGFVGRPAASPFIMAVGAVDANLQIGDFSARTGSVSGGGVDIAGPGVDILSSWPVTTPPGGGPYKSINGTSMATPHVAGIAALWSQVTGATGMALWGQLALAAKRLPLPSVDVGAGLVQAPQD